jgi:hypothetical protein
MNRMFSDIKENSIYMITPSYGHIRNMKPNCMSIDINKPNYISIQSCIQKDYYYSWDFSNINNAPKRINNKLKYQRDRNTRYQNKLICLGCLAIVFILHKI